MIRVTKPGKRKKEANQKQNQKKGRREEAAPRGRVLSQIEKWAIKGGIMAGWGVKSMKKRIRERGETRSQVVIFGFFFLYKKKRLAGGKAEEEKKLQKSQWHGGGGAAPTKGSARAEILTLDLLEAGGEGKVRRVEKSWEGDSFVRRVGRTEDKKECKTLP